MRYRHAPRKTAAGGSLALLLSASIAAAQWTRVLDLPPSEVVSVWANGDTIAAGTDSIVYVTTNAGVTWKPSVKVVGGVTRVTAEVVRNGRLYAGTRGQGVFVSDDLGDTWLAFNQGLTGGILNSHLFISDLLLQGGSLYAATSGAGVYVRDLDAGTWAHFGEVFEPNSASTVAGIAAGGSRLLAAAGGNGLVFFRDDGDAEWTRSFLDNTGFQPGLAAHAAAWSGSGWVVASNAGVFRSVLGQEPWAFVDLNLGIVFNASLVTRGQEVFAAFGNGAQTVIAHSVDDGATWLVLDTLSALFVNELALSGNVLYAARLDGLWRRSTTSAVQPASWGAVKSRFR